MDCDILIIGAGPAGLWAAKSAADQGFDTVILEEHLSLGHTKQCSGWLLGCTFMYEVFDQLRRPIDQEVTVRLYSWD